VKQTALRFAAIVFAFFVAACVTPPKPNPGNFQFTSENKRVLLVTPDVQLTEIDAGGLLEPRADWTEAARGFIDKGLRTHFGKNSSEIVNADGSDAREVQLTKLHGVVGQAIMSQMFGLKLPNKSGPTDWTLGPGTAALREHYGADYALFVFVRDSYSSDARKAVQVLAVVAAAAVGVAIVPQGGTQIGFASLVDLRTGNVVWFNRLLSQYGDLRTEAPAQKSVADLIKDMPI
jgi:hypothetical protein